MRIARAVIDGTIRLVVADAESTRLAPHDHPDDTLAAIASVRAGDADSWETVDETSLTLAVPVAGAGKIVAVGLNYADHTSETGFSQPERPLTFAKYPSSLTGPTSDVIVPGHLSEQVDYEVELTLLIGNRCGGTTPATVADVAGYTIANDVSARDVQFADVQWTRGKSFDTFTPLGPWLVTADEFGDPAGHSIYTRVNDEVRQSDTTSSLIFDIPTLLAFISDGVTLEPGDLILTGTPAHRHTGTPAGAGAFLKPPRYLRDGDTVTCGIDGIGDLRNRIVVR